MLSIIVSFAENYAIGKNGFMPWWLTEDLKRFAQITSGKTIIMGRKTFESLPHVLPNRKHVVITNSKDFFINDENVLITNDLYGTLEAYSKKEEETFIIGGASIFEKAIPYCKKLYLTLVEGSFEADTFFPKLNCENYVEIEKSETITDEKSGIKYKYVTLISKGMEQ